MRLKHYLILWAFFFVPLLLFVSVGEKSTQKAAGSVKLLRVPGGGLQPQTVMDEQGRLHLIYFVGEPLGGDIFYVRREVGKTEFTTPLRVNSEPNSAVATGTIRGAHLAIGKNRRLQVA